VNRIRRRVLGVALPAIGALALVTSVLLGHSSSAPPQHSADAHSASAPSTAEATENASPANAGAADRERLTGSEHESTPLDVRRVTDVPTVTDVSRAEIEAYLVKATDNKEARQSMDAYLTQIRHTLGVQFTHDLICRGSVCKATLVFSSQQEAMRLQDLPARENVQFLYQLVLKDLSTATLTIFSAAVGETFRAIVDAKAERRRKGRGPTER